jgi:hypothetical protein
VLVTDDVGLLPLADRRAASAFFHVVNERYEKKHPTIVTTNRGLPDSGEVFGDPVVASAILDRLMHDTIVFNIRGPSWRLREHNGLEIATTHHEGRHRQPYRRPAARSPNANCSDRRSRLRVIAHR